MVEQLRLEELLEGLEYSLSRHTFLMKIPCGSTLTMLHENRTSNRETTRFSYRPTAEDSINQLLRETDWD